jgi:hypothetical protein
VTVHLYHLKRSLFLEPIVDEAGLGLLMRTARRLGFGGLPQLFSYICPDLLGSLPFQSQEGQLTMLCRWVGPVLDLSCDQVLARFSDLSLKHLFFRDRMRVERLTIGAGAQRVSHGWLAMLGAGPFDAQYCRACASEHFDRSGSTTWLRSHNLPGVRVCTKHGCWLDTLRFTPYDLSLPPAETTTPELANTLGTPNARDLKSARLLVDLLQADLPWIGHELRAKLFRQRLHLLESGPCASGGTRALYDVLSDASSHRLLMPGMKTAMPDLEPALLVIQALYGGSDSFISAVRSAVAKLDDSDVCEDALQEHHYLSLRPVTLEEAA